MADAFEQRDERASSGWRLVALRQRRDARGVLGVAEEGEEIPFAVKRLFYLYDVPAGASRGCHAHRQQHQLLIMMHGACTVSVDDGSSVRSVTLSSPAEGLYVPPLVWIELSSFSSAAVCAVLTSGLYDEKDYVRSYDEFRRMLGHAAE